MMNNPAVIYRLVVIGAVITATNLPGVRRIEKAQATIAVGFNRRCLRMNRTVRLAGTQRL